MLININTLKRLYKLGKIKDNDILIVYCAESFKKLGLLAIKGKPDFRKRPYKKFNGGNAGLLFADSSLKSISFNGDIITATAGDLAKLLND